MRVVDLSRNPRVARLARLPYELQQSRNPDQTLRALQAGFANDEEILASILLSTRALAPGEYRVVRMHLSDHPENDLDLGVCDRSPERAGGIIGAIVTRGQAQLLQDVDWSDDPHFRDVLQEYSSIIAVPFSGDRLPMNWVLLLRK